MREIDVKTIANEITLLCVKSNLRLPDGMRNRINECKNIEKSPLGKDMLCQITENIDTALELNVPICQDTGMVVVFIEIGQDVHLVGGDLTEAINSGVAKAYTENSLRCSIVTDPLIRNNSNDNTPAIIHTKIVPGNKIKLIVSPKGFGSENMSAIRMFKPTADMKDVISFIKEVVSDAGSSPCPPMVIGVGIGGDFEYSAILAKKALCRDMSIRNPDPLYNAMEEQILTEVNKLGIGPQGFGGTVTALYVNIETFPTHIAGLPVAVNIGCHVNRHASATL